MVDIEYTHLIQTRIRQVAGDDRMLCDTARVSTLGEEADAAVKTIEDDAGLINFLMRNKHGSPFEHGSITFIVYAPIFVFWDHVRHRIGVSYNIESSRYRKLQPRFYVAEQSRTQTGKPGHYVMSPGNEQQTELMRKANEIVVWNAWNAYQSMLEAGIAREQAMQVLPMSTMITAYVTFNPRSLMKFLELRLGPARQEMQQLAALYAVGLSTYWPATYRAFENNGRIAP